MIHIAMTAPLVTGQNLVVDGGMTLHGVGVDGVLDRVKALLAERTIRWQVSGDEKSGRSR